MRTASALFGCAIFAASAASAANADAPGAPLTLARVLALVEEQAPELLVSEAQVEVSAARVDRAEAARLPRLGVSSAIQPGAQVTLPLYPTADDDRAALCSAGNLACSAGARPVGSARIGASVDARWRLFDFGINDNNVDGRGHALDAVRARTDNTRAELAAAALKRFLLVLADDELVVVRRRLAEDRARQAQIVRARVEVGEVSPTDAIQTEVAAEAAALDLAAAEAAARADRVPLATSLGLPPTASLVVQGDLALTVSPPVDVTHPAQRAIEADTRAAESDRKAADAARWPTVDGTASFGTSSIGTTVPNVNLTPQAGLGVSLDWPVLDFGVNADQRIAAANLAVASKQRAAEVLRIAGERERATITLEAQQGLRDRAARLVESARAALAAVEGRYQAGAARIAELLEAQTALAQAEVTLVQARLGAAQAAIDVALAHGVVDATVLKAP